MQTPFISGKASESLLLVVQAAFPSIVPLFIIPTFHKKGKHSPEDFSLPCYKQGFITSYESGSSSTLHRLQQRRVTGMARTAWTAPQVSCGGSPCLLDIQRSPVQGHYSFRKLQFSTSKTLSNFSTVRWAVRTESNRPNGLFKMSKLHYNSFFHHLLPFYYHYLQLVSLFFPFCSLVFHQLSCFPGFSLHFSSSNVFYSTLFSPSVSKTKSIVSLAF